ncbi:hypothetical protein DOTSEDRAFT_67698 [Dothistroma septosporum NZE10]|uniref:Uncharacterized protein n=1 Tax=Dothistroma septosporum (strain NZE10 / CBS 128990) TaxID=675120 RepID=N1Q286_DOTSN|nr:hypothetical protein DOTSEDRAFT_67698 [Dothistroma septosporum NZE10]
MTRLCCRGSVRSDAGGAWNALSALQSVHRGCRKNALKGRLSGIDTVPVRGQINYWGRTSHAAQALPRCAASPGSELLNRNVRTNESMQTFLPSILPLLMSRGDLYVESQGGALRVKCGIAFRGPVERV